MAIAVLNLDDIERIIREEAAAQGGYVHEFISDEQRLYARTINTPIVEVAPKDALQAGVAVRVDRTDVWVRPYVFRQVCWNGAIVATSEEAEQFEISAVGSIQQQERHLRTLISAAGNLQVLHREVKNFRGLESRPIDRAMMIVTMTQTHHKFVTESELLDILAQFEKEEPNAWGMMNAITAVARRTRDHERKWQLEELGAMVPVLLEDPFRSRLDALDYPIWESEDSADSRELVHA